MQSQYLFPYLFLFFSFSECVGEKKKKYVDSKRETRRTKKNEGERTAKKNQRQFCQRSKNEL